MDRGGKGREFRRYRVALKVIYGITVGGVTLLLVASVIAQLFFSSRYDVNGPAPDLATARACAVELAKLDKQTHTEAHALFDENRPEIERRWASFSSQWLRQWRKLGVRCKFAVWRDAGMDSPYIALADAYEELPEIRLRYQETLLRYARRQVDAIISTRERIEKARAAIGAKGTP